jgi:predicted CXXCH cytochrome family protein
MKRMSSQGGLQSALVLAAILGSGASAAVPKPTTPQATCMTAECHAEYKSRAVVHGPVSLGECKQCHEAVSPAAHTFRLARPGRDLCEYCHTDQTARKVIHEPLTKGECTQCHDPHGSEGKALLREKTVAAQCAECHRITDGKMFLHGPTAVGECSICHNPHSSDYPGLTNLDPRDLCVSCHVVTQEEVSRFAFIHEPAKGDCVGCHDPHGGSSSKILKAQPPDMCYACHKDIQKLAETSAHQHSVVREAGGCLKCHTPHASTVRYLMAADPATLCLRCHNKPVAVNREEVVGAFEIEHRKFLHGPVQNKTCSGCHQPHGSEKFRLLAEEYPPLFYAPYSKEAYALCFSCHSETGMVTESTTDLTDFRNGSLNLHALHVSKSPRGRTCRACHETHASDLPSHIRQSVPYGMWNLPIGFSKTGTGGSCSPGCHVPKGYDRVTPAQYPAGSPQSQSPALGPRTVPQKAD